MLNVKMCVVCPPSMQALAANMDTGLSHFQPMVAILCGHGKLQNQYLDENKKWISDPDPKATCTKDKLEILEYCRKVSTSELLCLTFPGKFQFLLLCHCKGKIYQRCRKLRIPEIWN